ncbi:MAG: chlorite dismutase family protein [Parvularculaceae bacterium]
MSEVTWFRFGADGQWAVRSMSAIIGAPIASGSAALAITPEPLVAADVLVLRGVASNVRYAKRTELAELRAVQEGLGRPAAAMAALLPISKSAGWWLLAQDERREIFEEQSRHHSIGVRYLPEIARKLYHCRDLGEDFDFLTWFEFAPAHEMLFNELLDELRASREWTYVTREIDIRLTRVEG